MNLLRLLLLVFITFFSLRSYAQISVLDSDMPFPGQVINTINANPTAFDPSETGPNYNWDYSDLTELDNSQDTAIAIDDVPGVFQLFFNNPFIYPSYVSDFGFTGLDLNLGAVNATNILNFFRITGNAYEATGFGTELNGTPIPVLYDPKDIVYEFPLNYDDSTHSFAHFEIQIPTIGYWEEDIDRVNEVDGWGMVTTPSGTYEVLRVKSTLNLVDSVYIDLLMTGTTIEQPTRIEYKWIAKDKGIPVLTITDFGGLGFQVTYLNEVVDNIDEIKQETISIYPNPVNDFLFVQNIELVDYEIIDLSGRLVLRGSGMNKINVDQLNPGNYLLKIDDLVFRKFVKLDQW